MIWKIEQKIGTVGRHPCRCERWNEQALAVHRQSDRKASTCRFEQGGNEVCERDPTRDSLWPESRYAHDERDVNRLDVAGPRMDRAAVFFELFTMVCGEYEDGVVPHARLLEIRPEESQHVVEVSD